jgi:hypothetical protein
MENGRWKMEDGKEARSWKLEDGRQGVEGGMKKSGVEDEEGTPLFCEEQAVVPTIQRWPGASAGPTAQRRPVALLSSRGAPTEERAVASDAPTV